MSVDDNNAPQQHQQDQEDQEQQQQQQQESSPASSSEAESFSGTFHPELIPVVAGEHAHFGMTGGDPASPPEQSRWDSVVDCLFNTVTKFCSLTVASSMLVGEIVYLVGVGKLTSSWGKMERTVVAHFLAALMSLFSLLGYLYIFFKGLKQQQFMSFLTALLVASFMMVGHSIGIAAPTVIDCGGNFSVFDTFGEVTGNVVNEISNATVNRTLIHQHTTAYGTYAQSLVGCHDQTIVLGGAIVVGFFQLVAVFDVQRLLLRRVRAKTYGERFTEMGIK